MGISDRIESTIERWRKVWGEALKSFLSTVVGFGIEVTLDVIGKKAAPTLKPLLDKIEALTDIPPELKPFFDEMKEPSGEWAAFLAQTAAGSVVGGALMKVIDYILRPLSFGLSRAPLYDIPEPKELIALWLRDKISPEDLKNLCNWLGVSTDHVEQLKELSQVRLNPEAVSKLWLRDAEKYDKFWKDLKDSGVSPDRIEAFKELAYVMPTPQELTLWAAKEAFEPEMISFYGLDDEFDKIDLTWFNKAGVRPEIAKLNWRAHWMHPALGTVQELLHRGEITPEDMYRYYRLVEIPPLWRDKLTAISWDLPNRIELRMMARYGLVDKDFLVTQLEKVGLAEEYRSIAADMMLAMGIRTDLSTRYSKGWLNKDTIKSELEISGLSSEVQERLYQWIVKNVSEDRVEKERDLTLSDVYKGVKKAVISYSQAVELIMDMGFDEWEAKYKLEVNVGALEGSPETYQELKRLTQLRKQALGQKADIPSLEKIQAEKDLIALEAELVKAKEEALPQAKIAALEKVIEAAKIAYHQLKSTT